jgi:hypothetical protein
MERSSPLSSLRSRERRERAGTWLLSSEKRTGGEYPKPHHKKEEIDRI